MKKVLKKIILLITVLAMCVSFAACSGSKGADVSTPEGTVEAMLTAFAATDYDEIEKYVDLDKILSREDNEDLLADPEIMMKEVFSEIKFNIVESVEQDDGTYLVKTQIVTTDMGSAISEYIVEVMSFVYSDDATSEEDVEKYQEELFMEKITADDRNVAFNEVDIKVVKDGDAWKVEADDELANAVLGGFHKSIETLMEQIAATEENNGETEAPAEETEAAAE